MTVFYYQVSQINPKNLKKTDRQFCLYEVDITKCPNLNVIMEYKLETCNIISDVL